MRLLTTLFLTLVVTCAFSQSLRDVYNAGMAAYKSGDFLTYLEKMKEADSLSPMHQTIVYNLASAYAKNDQHDMAIEKLKVAININAGFEPESDEDFSEMDLSSILTLKEKLNAVIKSSEVAFTNSELDLHPESVAHDPETGHFFLNSVRKGKILRFNPMDKEYSTLIDGRWAVMGMKVKDGFLWGCEVATNEHENYSESDQGKTALLKFNLKSGELVDRWELEGGHWFGDLIFSKSGKPFISDSMKPIIYTLQNDKLEVFKDFSDDLFNLQGLAFNEDETVLYIADYKLGIYRMEMETGVLKPISSENYLTKGTDGLYFYQNSLIAIQNGVRPFRVSRIALRKNGLMEDIDFLEKATSELGEPTLGVVVGNQLFYVANSPWGAYKEGVLQTDGLTENLVLKVNLN